MNQINCSFFFVKNQIFAQHQFSCLTLGWRHADARCSEDKQVQDDQAADDVRGQSQHKEPGKQGTEPLLWKHVTIVSVSCIKFPLDAHVCYRKLITMLNQAANDYLKNVIKKYILRVPVHEHQTTDYLLSI